jgi:aminoglycoside phosphotransferase (APT) family kinase protein
VTRLSGGASQETWAFDLLTRTGAQALILRREPLNGRRVDGSVGVGNEPSILSRCLSAGVPVPKVIHVLSEEEGLGVGFIMTRAMGEVIPKKLLTQERFARVRPRLAYRFGEILAAIHSADVTGFASLVSMDGREAVDYQKARLAQYQIENPVFALAIVWLEDNVPPHPITRCLVHGDFRTGNIMIEPEGVTAILDWELAHIGDPMEDLGWLCMNSWRFGLTDRPAGGFGQREELFAGYRAAGGLVDPRAVYFWEVLGSLRWGITCTSMARVFESGQDTSVERAMIARRVSETLVDLLNLMAPRV